MLFLLRGTFPSPRDATEFTLRRLMPRLLYRKTDSVTEFHDRKAGSDNGAILDAQTREEEADGAQVNVRISIFLIP